VRRHNLLERIQRSDTPSHGDADDLEAVEEMHGDLLRMLFACCDPSIVPESSLVFALKTLCGFSIPEVATRLFITEANVYKRFTRARNAMKALGRSVDRAQLDDSRLPAVHRILYAMFSEGHLSAQAEMPLRKDLCEEAIRLTTLLADSPPASSPETHALLALMHLHASRMTHVRTEQAVSFCSKIRTARCGTQGTSALEWSGWRSPRVAAISRAIMQRLPLQRSTVVRSAF
jgi:predicted RNA polymerase sigma factor